MSEEKKLKKFLPSFCRSNHNPKPLPKKKPKANGSYFVEPIKPPEPKIELTFYEVGLVGEIKRSRGISWKAAEKLFLEQKRAKMERRRSPLS